MITTGEIEHVLSSGGTVVGNDGDTLGAITQVLRDDRTGGPAWVTVMTGRFGRTESYVPLTQASVRGDVLVVPYDRPTVEGAPSVADALGDLSDTREAELRRYYGLEHTTGR